jgi:hypothetical protein
MKAELAALDTAGAKAEWLRELLIDFTSCREAYTGYFYEL